MQTSILRMTFAAAMIIGFAGEAIAFNMHVPRSVVEDAIHVRAPLADGGAHSSWPFSLLCVPDSVRAPLDEAFTRIMAPGAFAEVGRILQKFRTGPAADARYVTLAI